MHYRQGRSERVGVPARLHRREERRYRCAYSSNQILLNCQPEFARKYEEGVLRCRELGSFVPIRLIVGWTKQIGPLVRFSETPSEIRGGAPLLGQHTEEALAEEASIATAGTATPAAKGNTPQHPLDGLLVLDFASWLAAPVGSALIADLGARVIKVEPPLGDEFRNMSKGRARTFQGKESLVLDLKTPEARTALEKLIARADVLMHNMRGEAPIRAKAGCS